MNGQVGSVYKQTPPLVNAMRRPGEWNVFDIIYSAPVFKKDGTYRVPPYVTVILNGVVLQNHTAILGTTEYIGFPRVVPHGAGPLRLQAHGDPSAPISFRTLWIRDAQLLPPADPDVAETESRTWLAVGTHAHRPRPLWHFH